MSTNQNLFNLKPTAIVMYSAAWCSDCRRAKRFFEKHQIPYENVDVDENPDVDPFVKELNNGNRVVPTIIFPNGDIMVEPSNAQLVEKFGF